MNKRNFMMMLVASAIGSLVTIASFKLVFEPKNDIHFAPKTQPVRQVGLAAPNASFDFSLAAEKTMPAVVHIKSIQSIQYRSYDPFREFFGDDFFSPFYQSPRTQKAEATGSGVVVNESGYIITNNHVINNAESIEVTTSDNRSYTAKLVGTDPSTDLALIKIEVDNMPFIEIANSDNVQVGQWVVAVGNPFNLNSTVTAGIVSAKARNINILKSKTAIESFIQTDAAVNPGNSGGALVNLNGELIGVNTAIASPTGAYAGYAFAVPSNIVAKVVADLLEFGKVQRGYLGIGMKKIDGILADKESLERTEGVYVNSLSEDGPAQKAGIKPGDVIVKVNDIAVKTIPEYNEQVGRYRPGDKIKISIDRKGAVKDIFVTLQNSEGNTEKVFKGKILDDLGAELDEMPTNEAKKYGLEHAVVVTELQEGKLRKYTDIMPGFVITKIDGKRINTIAEMQVLLENKEDGSSVMFEGFYKNAPRAFYYYGFTL